MPRPCKGIRRRDCAYDSEEFWLKNQDVYANYQFAYCDWLGQVQRGVIPPECPKCGFHHDREAEMPSVSKKQARTMRAAAHDPKFAKKLGISEEVAKDFVDADMKKKAKKGPRHRCWLFVAGMGLAAAGPASAQTLYPCSQTVGITAVAPAFGSRAPQKYLEICNAHASNTLGVNPSGSQASIGSIGTRTLAPGACWAWNLSPPPNDISIIGSATGTTTACQFQ